MKIYKIRQKSTGLFSKGGNPPKFDKIGKTWTSFKNIKLHFMMISASYNDECKFFYDPDKIKDLEVIEYRLVCTSVMESYRFIPV
jgi:hypothetical protein